MAYMECLGYTVVLSTVLSTVLSILYTNEVDNPCLRGVKSDRHSLHQSALQVAS